MKKVKYKTGKLHLIFFLFSLIFLFPVSVIANDPPHNDASGVTCGIYAEALSAPLSITGTTITDNTGGGNTAGAGIFLINNGTQMTTITGSTLSNNDASDYGGAVYLSSAKVSISGSTINNNSVTDSGMLLVAQSMPLVQPAASPLPVQILQETPQPVRVARSI